MAATAQHPLSFGIYIPQVAFSFDDMLDRALRCEQLGFESLWLYDHFYSPGIPHRDSLEAWTLATALLARTTTLRVGHMVLCNNFRHPALLGKMIATLDAISNGRLEIGIGSGSVGPEHEQAGLPWGSVAQRSARLRDTLEILSQMLTSETTTYEGELFQVRDLPNLPQPVQTPRPPILIGGTGEKFTLPLVARYADIWNIPTYALGELDTKVAALEAECERIGRDPATIRYSIEAVVAIAEDDASLADTMALAERRFGGPGFGLHEGGFVGTPQAVVDRVGALRDKGFSHFVFFTPDRGGPTLEIFAKTVMPAFA